MRPTLPMNPLSLAGLGLGAVSVAFELFAGYIKGFVLLSSAHNMGKDSSTLLCMLNLQELQLTEWARRAGLLAPNGLLDRRLNEFAVCATLKELRDLLLDTDKLRIRYTLDLTAQSLTPPQTSKIIALPATQGIMSQAISNNLRADIMYRARLIQSENTFPKRLWWAAVEKPKFEVLIEKIKSFTSEFWHLSNLLRQDDMAQNLQVILSQVIGRSAKTDELWSLREMLMASSSAPGIDNSQSQISPLASVAEIKALQIRSATISYDGGSAATQQALHRYPSHLSHSPRGFELGLDITDIQDYDPIKNYPEMGTARYKGQYVFFEWKPILLHHESKIIERVQNLALLLNAPKHPDCRSLPCKGLARDDDGAKVAFVFDAPSSTSFPQSLRDLFSRSIPSVTERIRLALQLTQSIKYFHTAGWLHLNLRSENVLFWSSDTAIPSLSQPVVAGFTFSRPDSPREFSEEFYYDSPRDIYRHPNAMGGPSESFSAAKDVYALGTVLLEIGE